MPTVELLQVALVFIIITNCNQFNSEAISIRKKKLVGMQSAIICLCVKDEFTRKCDRITSAFEVTNPNCDVDSYYHKRHHKSTAV